MAESENSSATDAWTCQQLISRLAYALDHGRLDDLPAIFATQPRMRAFGKEVTGLAEIASMFRALTETATIRHCVTPAYFETLGVTARAHYYGTVLKGPKAETDAPILLTGVALMVDYTDTFVREAGEWRIEQHDIQMIFRA